MCCNVISVKFLSSDDSVKHTEGGFKSLTEVWSRRFIPREADRNPSGRNNDNNESYLRWSWWWLSVVAPCLFVSLFLCGVERKRSVSLQMVSGFYRTFTHTHTPVVDPCGLCVCVCVFMSEPEGLVWWSSVFFHLSDEILFFSFVLNTMHFSVSPDAWWDL